MSNGHLGQMDLAFITLTVVWCVKAEQNKGKWFCFGAKEWGVGMLGNGNLCMKVVYQYFVGVYAKGWDLNPHSSNPKSIPPMLTTSYYVVGEDENVLR